MPDPISPKGSPGQILGVASALTTPVAVTRSTTQNPSASPAAPSWADQVVQAQQDAEAAAEAARRNPDPASVEKAVQTMRDFLKNLPSNLEIRADKETGYITYKVVNPITGEVIRQYPPDEMVELARKMRKLSSTDESGILLDRNL